MLATVRVFATSYKVITATICNCLNATCNANMPHKFIAVTFLLTICDLLFFRFFVFSFCFVFSLLHVHICSYHCGICGTNGVWRARQACKWFPLNRCCRLYIPLQRPTAPQPTCCSYFHCCCCCSIACWPLWMPSPVASRQHAVRTC